MMPARNHAALDQTGPMILISLFGLVLMALLLTVTPVKADAPSQPADTQQAGNVSQSIERLSKGRVTTLATIAEQAKWRTNVARRLSNAIAAIEAETKAASPLAPQTAERPAGED